MKAIMAQSAPDGEQPKTLGAVAHALPSNKFLQNIGLKSVASKRTLLLLQHMYSWCNT